jgi:hypothetical protein
VDWVDVSIAGHSGCTALGKRLLERRETYLFVKPPNKGTTDLLALVLFPACQAFLSRSLFAAEAATVALKNIDCKFAFLSFFS